MFIVSTLCFIGIIHSCILITLRIHVFDLSSMILCVCKAITESEFTSLLEDKTLEAIIEETGICTQCTSCKLRITEIILEKAHESISKATP